MANVPSLKGVRTRFRNILDQERTTARAILDSGLDKKDADRCRQDSSKCLKILNIYCKKLEDQVTKLTDAVGDSDTAFVQQVLDDDFALILSAEQCAVELEQLLHKVDKAEIKAAETSATVSESESLVNVQRKMQEMLSEQMKAQRNFFEKQSRKESDVNSSVKLPKLELSSFGGNKLKWTSFWDAFECTVHNNKRLSNIEKFNYLLSKLFGEARRAVEGLALSNDNYDVAIDIIHDRFGNKQEVVTTHYKALINISAPSTRVDSLRTYLDDINKHLRSLEVLKENVDQQVFVSIITSKLPEVVLRQLELTKGATTEWTVSDLREQLSDYVSACEKAERASKENKDRGGYNREKQNFQSSRGSVQQQTFDYKARKNVGSAETLLVKTKDTPTTHFSVKCRYCSERHWSDECKRFKTINERKGRLKGACFKCLKDGHITRDCKSKKQCVYCTQYDNHHRSLCPKKFGTPVPSGVHLSEESGETPETSSGQKMRADECSGPVLMSSGETVLMQTAKTDVTNVCNSMSKSARILLDSGSQRTYITESLAKTLGLKAEEEQELKLVTFGSAKTKVVKTKAAKLGIVLKNGTHMTVTANIVPTISGTMKRNPLKQKLSVDMEHLLGSVDLADSFPTETETSTVEVLIGNDYYLDIVLPQRLEMSPGLYLLSSKLGWILTGRVSEQVDDRQDLQLLVMTYGTDVVDNSVFSSIDSVIPTKPDLEDFWNVELIGLIDKQITSEDQIAMDNFNETLKYEDGRYYVTWPWKEEDVNLPVNRELAYGRLKSCVRKLSNKPKLFEKYDSIIQDQLEKGVIERVEDIHTSNPLHYIPHHAVLNPKFRVVYDASAKTRPDYNSLNECLCRGPVRLHDLCGLLMRFRLHPVALVSDIEKAFLQVGLLPSQRDVTRFLWLKDCQYSSTDRGNIQEYRFCRVPFGVISSPFLLGATIESHLDKYDTAISKTLKDDIYCDNVITGAKDVADAVSLYRNAKSIFKDASMNLREWISNSASVNACLPVEDRAELKVMNVLGHRWDYEEDTLSVISRTTVKRDTQVTKRNILKAVASVFDPLGLVAPVVLRGKTLLQRLWSRKLNWDDPVDDDFRLAWESVQQELEHISDIAVPRCVVSPEGGSGLYNLLCFCDASKDAYATSVYLQQESEYRSKVDLVFAKTRLAPVKEMSIPRLELMAVLIGARCAAFVKDQLKVPIKQVFLWTDSQCVLGWLKSEKALPVFVKNRVSEIKAHDNIRIGYVNTKENPADVATRGSQVDDLRDNTLWWHGPEWLSQVSSEWQSEHVTSVVSVSRDSGSTTCIIEDGRDSMLPGGAASACSDPGDVHLVANEDKGLKASCKPCAPFSIESEKFSSLSKLFRVTAYVMRFVARLRGKICESGPLKSSELLEVEHMWLRYVQGNEFVEVLDGFQKQKPTNLQKQLGLFIDGEGLLRCRGRLEHSELSEGARFPVLLPKVGHVTKLIVEKVHKQNLHSGVSHTLSAVRQRYWILHGRATVRSILRACCICRRHEGGPYEMPPMASLPKARVNKSKPFSYTGVDYLGPLYVKSQEGPKKVWICLFTCFVTRAIHLEVVLDMTTEEYLMCFRRFIAQRGTPVEVVCDNARHFKAASSVIDRVWSQVTHNDDVQSYYATREIKCSFIVELAPWMGGFYERLVGVVKRAMRKTVGRKMLTVIQLQTLVKEVEAVVNSRPLVYVDEDINSSVTLTPSHFLTLNPDIGVPEVDFDESDPEFKCEKSCCDKLLKTWKKGQKLLDMFWKIWRDEYLVGLRERMSVALKQSRVKSQIVPSVGSVVLLKDDLPRGCWKLGRITQLILSRDGRVRSAKIKTASGKTLGRPLKLLYPLECSEDRSSDGNEADVSVRVNKKVVPDRRAAKQARLAIRAQLSDKC